MSLELLTKNGQLRVTEKEIMNLFQTEKIRNTIGISTGIVYHIDIARYEE
jgi:hypothetical protein